MIQKIISDGQTGVDRAALDFANKHDIPYGGWVPKGRITEDGTLPEKYRLQEMPTGEYSKRTEKNILDSDGTLIVSHGTLTGGSALTREFAKQHGKPWIHIQLELTSYAEAARMIREWIERNGIKILNVAGARGSKDPKIYPAVMDLLEVTHPVKGGWTIMPSSLESLRDIKAKAIQIQRLYDGDDEKWIEKTKATYEGLVDRFYRENEDNMAIQQYEMAKKDFEYFMRMVDLAVAYYSDGIDGEAECSRQRPN